MARTIVIGDIHGALRALENIISQIRLQKTDQLIFLGDYVDGWSESAEVIEYLLDLEKNYPCIFIKGNHDDWCERWLTKETVDEEWIKHGGTATQQSYARISKDQIRRHTQFFNRLKLYYIDKENRLFVHAGFTSMHGPIKEHFESNFFWDRTLWEAALGAQYLMTANAAFFPKRLTLFKEIFIGHTPTLNYDSSVPMQANNVWNIDTGAAFTGKLTALDIDSKTYFQSAPVFQLYPNESGRN